MVDFRSPGVFLSENDQTFRPTGTSEISGGFVGPAEKGPAFQPVVVESPEEYIDTFGRGGYYLDFAVINYLTQAESAVVVRTLGGSPSVVEENKAGYVGDTFELRESTDTVGDTSAVDDTGQDVFAVLAPTGEFPDGGTVTAVEATVGGGVKPENFIVEIDPGSGDVLEYMVSLNPARRNYITKIFGTNPSGVRELYVESNFKEVHEEMFLDSAPDPLPELELVKVTGSLDFDNLGFSHASTPWVVSQDVLEDQPSMEEIEQLFRFHTLSDGNAANTELKVGIRNIRSADEVNGSEYGLFDVVVREYEDTDLNPIVLETFNNVSIDPSSTNYIARRVGNRNTIFGTSGDIQIEGEYENASDYIRVEVNDDIVSANEGGRNDKSELVPWGFEGYLFPFEIDVDSILPHGLKLRLNQSRVDAEYSALTNTDWTETQAAGNRVDSRIYYGFDFTVSSNENYVDAVSQTPYSQSGITTSFNFSTVFPYDTTNDEDSFDQTEESQRKFAMAFQGGFDGKDVSVTPAFGEDITATNTQGFDCSEFDSPGTLAYVDAINILNNPEDFNINLLTTPGIQQSLHPVVVEAGIGVSQSRDDVIYVTEMVGPDSSVTDAVIAQQSLDSSYATTYYPWVRGVDNTTNQIISIPPSVLMPRVYAFNDQVGNPWTAPAGLRRGIITNARETVRRLGQNSKDELYENNINPIITTIDGDVVIFGQKTLQQQESALDRVNVRRLLINIKKFMRQQGLRFTFEQNTQTRRDDFVNSVIPFFEQIQQQNGLERFVIQSDSDNNPPEKIDQNIMVVDVFLVPVQAAEFIDMRFNILGAGTQFEDETQ